MGERPEIRRDVGASPGEQPAQVLRRAIAHVESLLQRVDPAAVRGAAAEPTVVPFEALGNSSHSPLPPRVGGVLPPARRAEVQRLLGGAASDTERLLDDARAEAAAILASARRAASDMQEHAAVLLDALRKAAGGIEQALESLAETTGSGSEPALPRAALPADLSPS